ncbi:MAG: hypothetical protein M1823_004207 [Watsoniomyces obsoletus]|nr:MAG: hypothetical protein M1823_004207 [Watsoniomyces obsoletus]
MSTTRVLIDRKEIFIRVQKFRTVPAIELSGRVKEVRPLFPGLILGLLSGPGGDCLVCSKTARHGMTWTSLSARRDFHMALGRDELSSEMPLSPQTPPSSLVATPTPTSALTTVASPEELELERMVSMLPEHFKAVITEACRVWLKTEKEIDNAGSQVDPDRLVALHRSRQYFVQVVNHATDTLDQGVQNGLRRVPSPSLLFPGGRQPAIDPSLLNHVSWPPSSV